ncbi:hypothetical protein QUA26_20285 [Microcoleus sp. Pol12A4]
MYSFFEQLFAVAIARCDSLPFLLSRTQTKKPFDNIGMMSAIHSYAD